MKKFVKTILSFGISFAMLFSCASVAYASNQSFSPETKYGTDLFAENYSEMATIEGTKYTFDYAYVNENKVVTITNMNETTVDTIVYNEAEGVFYLNGVAYAWIETVETPFSLATRSNDGWTFRGESSHRITWAQGAGTATVAIAIATCLPGLGWIGVIGAIGIGALGTIAGASIGGTITTALYTMWAPNNKTQEKFVWSFRASTGDYYGPYTYYHTANYQY